MSQHPKIVDTLSRTIDRLLVPTPQGRVAKPIGGIETECDYVMLAKQRRACILPPTGDRARSERPMKPSFTSNTVTHQSSKMGPPFPASPLLGVFCRPGNVQQKYMQINHDGGQEVVSADERNRPLELLEHTHLPLRPRYPKALACNETLKARDHQARFQERRC